MADDSKQPETEAKRRPIADPRMKQSCPETDPVAQAAAYAGWAAGVALLVFLFWMAVSSKFGLGAEIALGVAVALALFWLKYHWVSVKMTCTGRGARIGANSTLFAVFVLGALVLVNVVSVRHHVRHDFTENQLFSLSQQTREVVKSLDAEVGIIAFLDQNSMAIEDRLDEYKMLSPKLTVQIFDPMTNPEKVREHNITMVGTIIVTSGDREEKVIGGDEEQLTSAILAVTSGKKTAIYFLTGHGEHSIEAGGGSGGLMALKANLENQQYECKSLTLTTEEQPKVPADCAVLVIAGPTEPIGQKEMTAIMAYADQKGKLLVALEPTGPDLSELLEAHGIRPLTGTVIDPQRAWYGAAQMPLVTEFGKHKVTENISGMAIALPTTRALEILDSEQPEEPQYPGAPPPPTKKGVALLETSPDAWLETATSGQVSQDPGELRGPLVMAAAVDEGGPQQTQYGMPPQDDDQNGLRMVVLGDSDMMTDEIANIGLKANIYFTLNAINWLTENDKLITIPPKDEMPRYMTMSAGQLKLVWAISVVIIPLLMLLAGAVVWWRRR